MKKFLSILLALFLCLSFCSCAGSTSTSSESTKIESSNDAIFAVKKDSYTKSRICIGLGFKFYYEKSLEYGTCKATMNPDKSWDVILYGNMTGFYDDAKTDIDILGFVMTATVSEYGEVISANVEKIN